MQMDYRYQKTINKENTKIKILNKIFKDFNLNKN